MASSAASRADLLVALETLAKGGAHGLRLATALGYEKQAPSTELIIPGRRKQPKLEPQRPPQKPGPDDTPHQAPRLLHVAVTEATRVEAPPSRGPGQPQPKRLPEGAGKPERPGPPPSPPLLVRPARLGPALRSSLRQPADTGLDLPALLRGLASGRTPKRLPRRRVGRLGDSVWVVMDAGHAMAPYTVDMQELTDSARRLYGAANVRLLVVRDSPDCLLAIDDEQQPWGRALPPLPPGQRVLLGSHLGLLGDSPLVRQRWIDWLNEARAERQASVAAWLPCTAAWVDSELADAASLHCLVQQGSLRRQRGRPLDAVPKPATAEARRDELLRQAALCLYLDPGLLRALRLSAPTLRDEPALEGLCWTAQPFVGRSRITRALTPEGIRRFRAEWSALGAADQQRIWHVMLEHQKSRGSFLAAAETMIVGAHAQPDAMDAEFQARLETSRSKYEELWQHAQAAGAEPDLASFAADMLSRQGADTRWLGTDKDATARLHALSGRTEVADGIDTQAIARAVAELTTQPAVRRILEWRRDGVWLRAEGDEPKPNSGRFRVWEAAPSRTLVAHPARGPRKVVTLTDGAEHQLASRDELPLTLTSESESLTLGDVPRPTWAHEWGRDERGLYALTPPLGPWQERLLVADETMTPVADRATTSRTGPIHQNHPGLACRFGVDDLYGVYATLIIQGITQRLRWIPPGEFWMGSTDEERARIGKEFIKYYADEAPRHRVTLTQGFWLADTACTQALWQALMSSNPSDYKGETLPVENVSHDDVEQFLERLRTLLPPDIQPCLPTEAEWEYACRAGTVTAFAFGDTVTHAQANIADLGEFAPPGKQAARSRKRQTVPVQSLPPNAWGLFEMHGNVWEWCADAPRKYSAGKAAVVDPGRDTGQRAALRAVRGGSWLFVAGLARSAFRFAYERSARLDNLGFRLALRSMSTGQATGSRSARDEPTSREPEASAKKNFFDKDGSR